MNGRRLVLAASAFAAQCVLGAVRLVPDGILAQSGSRQDPVGWTSCRFVAGDSDANVYFPGGLRLKKGERQPKRMKKSVPGVLMGDGRDVFAWQADPGVLYRLSASEEGLEKTSTAFRIGDWRQKVFLSPFSCRRGFGAKAKVFALDCGKFAVNAWDEEGNSLGCVFDFSGKLENPKLARAAAIHPENGDLLLGTYWPECRVHRFGADGRERIDEAWPFAAMAEGFAVCGGKVFSLGSEIRELTDTLSGGMAFGHCARDVMGLLRGEGGWWAATTQGAQYYSDCRAVKGVEADFRVGGMDSVTSIGLSGGRIMVAAQWRVYGLWLDDRRSDPFSGDAAWCSFKRWDGSVDSIERREGGAFVFAWSKGAEKEHWRFDPALTQWKDRDARLHRIDAKSGAARPANEDEICGYRVVAEESEIAVYDGTRKVSACPVAARAIAAEGRWLVAWVPSLKAILRLRLTGQEAWRRTGDLNANCRL